MNSFHFLAARGVRATMCFAVATALLAVVILPARSQTDATPAKSPIEQSQAERDLLRAEAEFNRSYYENLKKENDLLRRENDELRRRVDGVEAPLYAKYLESKKREYDFGAEMMTVSTHIMRHQYIAAYVILVLVTFVFLAGLWFAHVQLMAGLRPLLGAPTTIVPASGGSATAATGASDGTPVAATLPTTPVLPAASLGVTTIDASLQKVTVTSSVVGVVVLIISLAFLYVYTDKVYTLKPFEVPQPKLGNPLDTPADSNTKAGDRK